MAQFVRFVAHSLRRNLVPTSRRGGVRLAAGAGISSLLSYKVESDLAKPEASLKLENIHQEWSHKYLLQQSSLLNVESASVTLTQTVVAIQDCSRSYCSHLKQMTSLLTMSSDGLPLAYSSMEIYDMVVELRGIIKMEKEALLELGTFFTYVRKLMDSVAETSFLVGADYASLQASSRLASAEEQVKAQLGLAEWAEQELLSVEKDNVLKVGKKEEVKKLDTEWVEGELNKLETVEIPKALNTEEDDVNVTVRESESDTNDKESSENKGFTFDSNGDELIKISVRESDDDQIKISIKKEEDEVKSDDDEQEIKNENISSNFEYKMPTF